MPRLGANLAEDNEANRVKACTVSVLFLAGSLLEIISFLLCKSIDNGIVEILNMDFNNLWSTLTTNKIVVYIHMIENTFLFQQFQPFDFHSVNGDFSDLHKVESFFSL